MQRTPRIPLVFLAACLCPVALHAHVPRYGVGTVTTLRFFLDHLEITFDLSYDDLWAHAEMLGVDKNKDSVVQKDEADAYIRRQWERKVLPAIGCRLDGVEVPFKLVDTVHEGLTGDIYPGPFSLYFKLHVKPPGGPFVSTRGYRLEFDDRVVGKEVPAKPAFIVPFSGHAGGTVRLNPEFIEPTPPLLDPTSYWLEGERLVMRFEFLPSGEAPGSVEPANTTSAPIASAPSDGLTPPDSAQPVAPPARPERSTAPASSALARAIRDSNRMSPWEMCAWLLVAVAWGAGHAFTPGHGKTMVAAYLIGTQGRVRDAVILGLTTTFTHTVTIYTIGITVLLVANVSTRSSGSLSNIATAVCGLASGGLLIAMGLGLFYRRWRRLQAGEPVEHEHSHHHGHGHGHGHAHGHSDGPPEPPGKESAQRPESETEHSHTHSHESRNGALPDSPLASVDDSQLSADSSRPSANEVCERPRLRELLVLGFSGGLIPCPAGLVVISTLR